MTLKVIILRESLWQSLAKDALTTSMLVVAIGIGWAIHSDVMQWMGALLFLMWVLARSLRAGSANTMTVEQARKFLNDLPTTNPKGE